MTQLAVNRLVGGNDSGKRVAMDFYPTPPEVTEALLNFLLLPCSQKIWEPACGENDMVNAIRNRGYDVIGTDINMGVDFLTTELPDGVDWIITNPPFSHAEHFIRRCIEHKKPFALLLKSQYWHAKKRLELFREPPRVHSSVNLEGKFSVQAMQKQPYYGCNVVRVDGARFGADGICAVE